MAAKFGSFRYSFAEKREQEKFLSSKSVSSQLSGFSQNGEQDEEDKPSVCCSFGEIWKKLEKFWTNLQDVAVKAWGMGRSDPRKIVFSAKMGLALVLISLLIFLKVPIKGLSSHSVWAILTVVVVFEFSIGATLSKGFNRGLGTFSAGGLALGMAEMSHLAGHWEETVIILSIFITGFIATYAKLYPTMKPYEYGFRVFLLTYCFIMVSGYQTREVIHTAVNRFLLIALGAGVSLAVNICIYPIWAGEDLHNLVSKNFMGVANSLEGCVNGYLHCVEYKRIPSKILTYQASDDPVYSGYRSAVESTSQEDALVGFAIWEPPHGSYKMLAYPWKNYVKVAGSLRHCRSWSWHCMDVYSLKYSNNGFGPLGTLAKYFVGNHDLFVTRSVKLLLLKEERYLMMNFSGQVLQVPKYYELGNKVKRMEKLGYRDILYEVHEAAEDLQKKIDRKSYLLVNSESWEIGNPPEEQEAPQDFLTTDNDENRFHEYKSLSEAKLDLRSIPKSWDASNSNMDFESIQLANVPSDKISAKQTSLPRHGSFGNDRAPEEESKTYESASILSLVTFTSLLIEFVARLQNLVDSFEELSEKANFKEPIEPPTEAEAVGLWQRFCRCFKSKRRDASLLE